MVVDDNRNVREMMSLMLSEHGFTVHAAHDGNSGVRTAASVVPDLALVDIDLPDIAAYDVAASLRGNAATAGIRLVAVTGYGQQTDKERAAAAAFDRHFTKPVHAEALMAAIEQLIGKRDR